MFGRIALPFYGLGILSLSAMQVESFVPFKHNSQLNTVIHQNGIKATRLHKKKKKKSPDNDDAGDDVTAEMAMDSAFRELQNLKTLDDENTSNIPTPKTSPDEAFAKAMESLNLKDIVSDEDQALTPEQELEVMKDLLAEQDDQDEIAEQVKGDLLGGEKFTSPPKSTSPTRLTNYDDKMAEDVVQAAIEEALKGNSKLDTEALLKDEGFKKEVSAIFDRANEKLVASLEEIRTEQKSIAEGNMDSAIQKSLERSKEDEERLAKAEASMRKMLENVNTEQRNVQKAIEDLKKAQEEANQQSSISSLREGGIVKQAAYVGLIMFGLRGFAEGAVFLTGGDESHLIPAIVQTAIAIICAIGLKFL